MKSIPIKAENVCHTCMVRKKACDKTLPACGYCSSRHRICRYDLSAPKRKNRRLSLSESQRDENRAVRPGLLFSPQPVAESLHQLARYFIELMEFIGDDIYKHYARVVHEWLPIVPLDSFRQEVSLYQGKGCIPPADFTVLLLAVLTNILPSLTSTSHPPRASQELLYNATKSAFSQAQASLCTSPRLIQAGLLIALREFTCLRPEAAYISMMTCTGLAQICDIRATSMCMAGDGLNESGSRADEKERESLVYTMALLERLIICEMNPVDILPRTEFSGLDMSSLSEPNETPERGTTTGLQSSAPRHDELSMREPAVSGLEHAQSVFLLDRLMILMRISSSAEDKDYKLAKLVELDRHIQRFLGTVMGESEVMQTPHCPTIARCVRLLFLLHDSILETIQDCSSVTDTQQKQISYAALDTLCKMTLDVACLHGDGEPQAPLIPICCVYTLQAARRQLQLRNQLLRGDEGVSREIDSFVQAEGRYRKMWLS